MTSALALRASLAALMGNEGRAMTMRRIVAGAYNPADGSTASATTTDYPATGRLGNYRDAVVDGVLIKTGDRRCTIVITDATVIPAITDRLVVGADLYQIINVQERELGGTVIGFTLQVRR